MSRLAQGCRPFDRDNPEKETRNYTHLIKIGCDAREFGAPKDLKGDELKEWKKYKKPHRLGGFLICVDRLDPKTKNYEIDYNIMAALMPNVQNLADHIAKVKRAGLNAELGSLPVELTFMLLGDAHREEELWKYPGLFTESLQCWDGKATPFCVGDGCKARRRQADGSTKEIVCNPLGKPGVAAKDICHQSAKKDCKGRMALTMCLIHTGQNGKTIPLSRSLGYSAIFAFESSSGWNPTRILQALDAASKRVDGNLRGIKGSIMFAIQMKRNETRIDKTQQIIFRLNEDDIFRREVEIYERKMRERELFIEEKKIGLLSSPVAKAPVKPTEPQFSVTLDVEPEPETEVETEADMGVAAEVEADENQQEQFTQDTYEQEQDQDQQSESDETEYTEPDESEQDEPQDESETEGESESGNIVEGVVEEIKEKSGSNKKRWTLYSIRIGREWFGSFEHQHGQMATESKQSNIPVRLECKLSENGQYKNVVAMFWRDANLKSANAENIDELSDTEVTVALKKILSRLSTIEQRPIAEILKEVSADDNGRFAPSVMAFSMYEGKDAVRHKAAMAHMRSTLKKSIVREMDLIGGQK